MSEKSLWGYKWSAIVQKCVPLLFLLLKEFSFLQFKW